MDMMDMMDMMDQMDHKPNDLLVPKCDSCSSGQFAIPTSSTPIFIPPSCETCGRGKYSNTAKSLSCQSCPAGRENTDDATDPIYHNSRSDCENCTDDTYNPYPGKDCYFCPVKTLDGAIKCGEQCSVGEFKSSNGTTVKCTKCPVGFFSKRQNELKCKVCPRGFHSNVISAPDCFNCPKGKYGNDTAEPPVIEEISCTRCPTGRYNLDLGQEKIESCKRCQKGTYSATIGATSDR